ncbi:hypothetical protein CTAYLR_002582 [Chrysophaeum taylorii]|uniref:Tyrosinase copper-binding domain-containing protein n=1 Tax=Chrysophaeum taylorii TaxID=2483200 RepID=A0AAD7UFL4_9STRA|nr:hypothetical protein CTAYLR_002582 [Chrysophaeum taylorii]
MQQQHHHQQQQQQQQQHYGSVALPERRRRGAWPFWVRRRPHLVLLLVGLSGVMVWWPGVGPTSGRAALLEVGKNDMCQDEVCARASNEYERSLGRPIADGLFPTVLLETYQPTLVEASASDCEIISSMVEVIAVDGCRFEVVATAPGESVLIADGVKFTLTSKYVRRELRDLTREDRERYLDALTVLHGVEESEGRKKYGEAFHSIAWFVREHVYGASQHVCDHWHTGAAFENVHILFTNRYEAAIQAVDPRTCAHYWNYVVDARDVAGAVLWADDWFSSITPPNKVVDTGRWKYTPVPADAFGFSAITNAYGILASPWNTNPSRFVTRTNYQFGLKYGNVAPTTQIGCSAFRTAFETEKTLAWAMPSINTNFHASVHSYVGGWWNYDPKFIAVENAVSTIFDNSTGLVNAITKVFWRSGFMRCPQFCGSDVPATECECQLNPALPKKYPNATPYDILNLTGVLNDVPTDPHISKDDPRWELAIKMIANGGHQGTMSNDQSPADPIFWIVHGVQERYLQMLRWLNATGKIDFEFVWGYNSTEVNAINNWENVKQDADFPEVDRCSTCHGHRLHDLIALDGDPVAYTNEEFYKMHAPFSPHINYVYDQLLNWTDCGWVFGAMTPDETRP